MTTHTSPRRQHSFDQLAPYLRAVRAFPPLTREEEHEVALRARAGDASARRKLVQHNLAFVVAVASRQRRRAVPLEDLVQEGNLGLIRAAEKFDPHAGTRFITYAAWWIWAYTSRHLKRARTGMELAPRTEPPFEDAAGDGDAPWLLLRDERSGPEEACLAIERDTQVRETVERARERLGEVGWDLVRTRLGQDSPSKLNEIGSRWGMSGERVRQLELRTKEILRRDLAPWRGPVEEEAGRAVQPAPARRSAPPTQPCTRPSGRATPRGRCARVPADRVAA